MNKIRATLSGAGAVVLMFVTSYAVADSSPQSPVAYNSSTSMDAALEEVVVTARKRSETAQTTPIAMAVFSDAQIEKRQLSRLSDLQNSVPGLQFEAASEDQFNSLISLRGVATENDGQNADPGVAVYVDGLYQGTAGQNLSDADDVSRIEVLKGPQGTLYGRNSTGGAINLYHNLPTDTYDGWVRAGVGCQLH